MVANGVDPLQVDILSSEGDFAGEIEIIDPDSQMAFKDRFALRNYPKSFLPNPAKWQTFYSPTLKKGTYLLRLTQESHGKAKVFFYQGPFVVRMLMLPFISAFILFIVILTMAPTKKLENKPSS